MVHEGENAQETVVLAATQRAPSLESVVPDAPPAIVAVIDRALSFEKAGRWPGAAAMRDALREASFAAFGDLAPLPPLPERVQEAPTPGGTPLAFNPGATPGPTLDRPRPPWRRPAALLAVCAAALVLGVALVAGRHPAATELPPSVTAPAAVTPPSAQAPTVTPTVPAPEPSLAASSSTEPPASASSAPSAKVPPARAPGSSPPGTKGTAATASSHSPPLGSRCVPPYFFDAQGNRVFKKECL
jgi:eukaryotic-like serine/threonine-protein kinase